MYIEKRKTPFIFVFLKIASFLLGIVGISFLLPIISLFACDEREYLKVFLIPLVFCFIISFVTLFFTRKVKIFLTSRQTFFVVASSWVIFALLAALPYCFIGVSFVDALFESVSGITTTGATIFTEIEDLPRSINLWRCFSHWLGGMGVVTLTVALMPLLGIGGFQLIKAETTGPEKGKVTAKISTTAKVLWLLYMALTIIQTVSLKIAGMDWIDAMSHSFATLGTGGFSSKNLSVGAYNSVSIEIICTIFMLLSGVNFSLYFYLITGKFKDLFSNSELKAYIGIIIFFITAVTVSLLPFYSSFGESLRYSSFQVASILTTTGFSTTDYLQWPMISQALLFMLYFIGGCSGSTGGGLKVIRWVVLVKQMNNETKKMLHPHGVFSIRLNGRPGRKDIVFTVTSFFTVYFILIAITTILGCMDNLDIISSFSGALSTLGNVGPAFGAFGPMFNYSGISDFLKLWYCFVMLAGRLELYTMIIFFLPSFYKK